MRIFAEIPISLLPEEIKEIMKKNMGSRYNILPKGATAEFVVLQESGDDVLVSVFGKKEPINRLNVRRFFAR